MLCAAQSSCCWVAGLRVFFFFFWLVFYFDYMWEISSLVLKVSVGWKEKKLQ